MSVQLYKKSFLAALALVLISTIMIVRGDARDKPFLRPSTDILPEEALEEPYKPNAVSTEEVLPVDQGKNVELMFYPIILEAAERYKVDSAIVKAVIFAESGYNPNAISKKGAKGLMQLMPTTASALGVEDSFDPVQNIDAGVRYLKELMDQFDGDIVLALAAYNAGSRKVREYKGVPPFKSTQYYLRKVLQYRQYYAKQTEKDSIVEVQTSKS